MPRIYFTAPYLGLFAAMCMNTIATAQEAKVELVVWNQKNQGVPGVVWLNDGIKDLLFDKTDGAGRIEKNFKCAVGQTFRADPEDRVAYFSSTPEVCKDHVTLRVYSRETEKGPAGAIKTKIFQIDDQWYIEILKTAYTKKVDEIAASTATTGASSTRCSLSIDPTVYSEVYKIETNDTWQKVEQIGNMKVQPTIPIPDIAPTKFIFKNDCTTASSNITEVQRQTQFAIDLALGHLLGTPLTADEAVQ